MTAFTRRSGCAAALAVLLLAIAVGALKSRHAVLSVWRKTVPESGVAGIRISRPGPDRSLTLGGAAPPLAADLYLPPGGSRRASCALLLVHGNRRAGSRAPLYRLLARTLAHRGCLVLAPSLRGFGSSGPAPAGVPITAAALLADVERGLRAVDEMAPATAPRAIVGHSLGANLALRVVGYEDWRVVAIEPGRRLHERVVQSPAPDLDKFVAKLSRSLVGGVKDRETVRALYRDLDPERLHAGPGPRSVLILQGRGIPAEDRRSIESAAAARPGAVLHWLDSADHDFGVLEAGGFVFHAGGLTKLVSDTTLGFIVPREGSKRDRERAEG
jgi:pimeloyl-ACP methyl ester carboxylesterase